MPSHPHVEEYRAKLQELIEFGGSDNEENIRPAFQYCLDSYCRDHRERLVLIPELKSSPSNKPDGTVKDSLRMARGYWEAKDSHDDLDAEIQAKFNRGYPTDNIIFEDSQTAVLFQNRNEAMRVDMSRDGELHRLIRVFLDYELPDIQEFRNLCFVDTPDNLDWQQQGATGAAVTPQGSSNLGGLSEENWITIP